MISIEKTLLLDRWMRASTSLDGAAFVQLGKRFARVLAAQLATHPRSGRPRRRAAGAGPKGVLPNAQAQLFFLLFNLKAYPVQDVMGHRFGLSQPQVCASVAQLPARRGRALAAVMAHLPELKEVLFDGTVRPIARPQHKSRRDRHYSGRRKRTTVKNVAATTGGRVGLLTPTAPGRRHDKAEADRGACAFGGGEARAGRQRLSRFRDRSGSSPHAAQKAARSAPAPRPLVKALGVGVTADWGGGCGARRR